MWKIQDIEGLVLNCVEIPLEIKDMGIFLDMEIFLDFVCRKTVGVRK